MKNLFNILPRADRWQVYWASSGCDGSYAAEVERTTANTDPATNAAFTPPPEPSDDLFRRYTMAELLSEPDDFEWLVRGLLAQPTYGQIAGEMKTLKSYVLGFITVGLAAGVPIFDRFAPAGARPVMAYVGEGGRKLWTRRMRRICQAMDVNLSDLDLHPTFDVAPIPSFRFQESLRRDLDEIKPALVTLDPLYTYHGTATKASDLHQEGALLNMLSTPCVDAGSSLLAVNHMNQTGSGMSLKRITMAGSGEWADTWVLLAHREQPDVENGKFRLTLEIGSRQWGGTSWDLDLNIGRFDIDTGSHDGQISWDINRASATNSSGRGTSRDRARRAIIDTLADMPWQLTKTKIKDYVGGSKDVFTSVFDEMVEDGVIGHDKAGRIESGTTKTRLLWGMEATRADTNRPGCVDDDD